MDVKKINIDINVREIKLICPENQSGTHMDFVNFKLKLILKTTMITVGNSKNVYTD